MKVRKEYDTPSEPLPAIFWDVSCFFKHRLKNKSHVVSSGAEGNDCGLVGKAASEYRMNVPMKHTTLSCYGPGRALTLLLIMPFGGVDSQRTYHIDSTTAHPLRNKRELLTSYCHSGGCLSQLRLHNKWFLWPLPKSNLSESDVLCKRFFMTYIYIYCEVIKAMAWEIYKGRIGGRQWSQILKGREGSHKLTPGQREDISWLKPKPTVDFFFFFF